MGYRRRDARPRLALWMLVALGDVVLLLVGADLPVLFAMFGVVAVTVTGVAALRPARRATIIREDGMPARRATRAG
ncbi:MULTISPECIES: hypothetical protein [unclassified Micromonospora]|uniref:hypothetical protein n=1 Tax=unclassified Micromonospora TaxID=2617518 RepID=UPI00362B7AA2